MSRQEKGSRVRMLPARLQLQQRDAHTGSYPTVSRFSTDGRSGIYNTSFNDTGTVVFTSSKDYMPSVGFSANSTWLNDDGSFDTISTCFQEDEITLRIDDGKEAFAFAYAGKASGVYHATNFNILLKTVDGMGSEWAKVTSVYTEPGLLNLVVESNLVNSYSVGSKIFLSPHVLATTGSLRSQVIEGLPYVHFTTGQELTPFRDSGQPAMDGKSSNNPFFATGSANLLIGEGFSSPLWSKNKIEIDISVPVECGADLYISGHGYGVTTPALADQGVSHEMLYYNFQTKKWEGLNLGISYGSYHTGILGNGSNGGNVLFEDMSMIGFAPSIVNLYGTISALAKNEVSGVFEWQAAAGEPVTNFGFPYSGKFHATSSQLCDMSQYINAPFLVEKIVVELSAAYTIMPETYSTSSYNDTYSAITSITQSTVPASINNFFILNQKNSNKISHNERMEIANTFATDNILTVTIPENRYLSKSSGKIWTNTCRDIVTWGGISSFAANMYSTATRSGIPSYASEAVPLLTKNPRELLTRDCIFTSSLEAHDNLSALSWQGKVNMELPAKSPTAIDRADIDSASGRCFSYFHVNRANEGPRMRMKFGSGGRNGLGINLPNGRSYVSPAGTAEKESQFNNIYSNNNPTELIIKDAHSRYNPYILMPSDTLVFGWQQPLLNMLILQANPPSGIQNSNVGTFSSIRFLPGEAKVTLYGSYISGDKEHNDGTNQLLSSDSVHEDIGEG